jgi:predicted dehydrogenase
VSPERIRVGIVGCGDVAHRHYLPALAGLADDVVVAACVDPDLEAARRAAEAVASWSPDARLGDDLAVMLSSGVVDVVIDLAPAPRHGEINARVLDAGLALYTEKPLASDLRTADALIAAARRSGQLFLSAPGVAVTRRVRWLSEVVRSGRYGPATLVVAQHADPGPAAWREYTGDPRPFYAPGVGPVFDHGVYRLHTMTALLGPVATVQAMGAISQPTRLVRGGPLTGSTIEVTTPDHVLINLAFANGGLGQLLASFGTPSTRAPWLEVHCTEATISCSGQSYELDAPIDLYVDDDSPAATEGWQLDVDAPRDEEGVVEVGVRHLVECLRGRAVPVLTAEHARHVLDITLRAYDSIADGATHPTSTTF